MSYYSSKLSLNVILHVTILFTILSWLFMLYISNITSTFINAELGHIIKSSFESILYVPIKDPNNITISEVPVIPSISSNGLISTIINNIVTNIITSIQSEINDQIKNNRTIQSLIITNNDLSKILLQTTDSNNQQAILTKINNVKSELDLNIKDIIKNYNYDYFIDVFKQQDNTNTLVNEIVFTNIKFVNALLVIVLIFFIFISLKTDTLNIFDVVTVFTENIFTFIFVGMIELWFFLNVASKYIPAPPSLIFVSLFTSLKTYLGKYIK